MLAVLVIAGLVTAPLVTPEAAQRLSAATMSDITMNDMAMMSGDMPCCPDQQPSNDCHDCALVAMCISTFMQANPDMAAAAILIRQPTRTLLAAHDDALSDGLDRPPPDHPPRTLV
jgi:hypothetical protein